MGIITDRNIRKLESAESYDDAGDTGVYSQDEFALSLSDLIEKKGLSTKDVLSFSNISKSYLNELRDCTGQCNISRNKLLDLCLGIGADMEETNHLLRLKGFHPLDPRGSDLDRILIWGLAHHRSSIDIRETLCEHGLMEFSLTP